MVTLLFSLRDCFRARALLLAEILALRHQLVVLQRSSCGHKLGLRWADQVLWVWLSRLWKDWRSALLMVRPETVIAWQHSLENAERVAYSFVMRNCFLCGRSNAARGLI